MIALFAATSSLSGQAEPGAEAQLKSPAETPVADDVQRLVASLLGATPMVDDLRQLTDEIGGRPTGSAANSASVAWAIDRLLAAGVSARRESFEMPMRWSEISATARVFGQPPETGSTEGDADQDPAAESRRVSFSPRVVAMPFSTAIHDLEAPLVDAGNGTEDEFARLGESARGAFVLIETAPLRTIPDLFAEYLQAASLEPRAFAAGVAGVVYMGSRERDVLYRHNAALGVANEHPMLIMERSGAERALRLLRQGQPLRLRASIDVERGGTYSAENVIGEIRGSTHPDEVVVVGAHLDSWGLGTGALDNGCNVAMLIDIARQIKRLGLEPRRTIRFALWNGEEQGLHGSWGYVRRHRDTLDQHVAAMSFDIGSGRIEGFFTGGRPEVAAAVDRALEPVAGLGPFNQLDVPIVGTDNYDFMMEGVPNLVANQASANYGPNYHAGSDTFEQVDLEQLRLNAAIAAAVTWSFANQDDLFGPGRTTSRQSATEIRALVDSTDLADQMRSFGVYDAWIAGDRGLGADDAGTVPGTGAVPGTDAVPGTSSVPGTSDNTPGGDPMSSPTDAPSNDATPADDPDHGPAAQYHPELGDRFDLAAGEAARIDDPNGGFHHLRLVGVVEDSRCPTGANCVWAGEATVHVEIGRLGGVRHVKLTAGTNRRKPAAVGLGADDAPRVLRVLEVAPYPVAGERIAAEDYRVRFELIEGVVGETPDDAAPLR